MSFRELPGASHDTSRSLEDTVVKTGEQFLCDGEDGDIGLAPEIQEAKIFMSFDEAQCAANDNADPGYEILTIDGAQR